MMKIICINGKARSGKDLFCEYACKNYGLVYTYSTIDRIKEFALEMGWDGKKDEKGRKFLSDLKDAMTTYDDLPTKYVIEEIKKRTDLIEKGGFDTWGHDAIFFVHMREPKEIEKWEKEYGARSLLITRPEVDKEWGNHADDDVYNHKYHYFVDNKWSKEELEKVAIDFIDGLRDESWQSYL